MSIIYIGPDPDWQPSRDELIRDYPHYPTAPRRPLLDTGCAVCATPLRLLGFDDHDLLRQQFTAFEQGWRQRPDGSHVCPAHAGG